MEERINKLEFQNKIITGLLVAILVFVASFAIMVVVITVKTIPAVNEYKPVIDKLATLDVDTLNEGIGTISKLADSDIDMKAMGESFKQLENMQEMMGDFKEVLPKIEVLADAVSSISDKLDVLFKFFGR